MDLKWVSSATSWMLSKLLSVANMEVDEEMEASSWHLLPDTLLMEIYSHLSDRDRYNMSLVCTNWSRMFHTPRLWRKRKYDLGGYKAITNGSRANNFAEMFGRYVRYLSLSCSHPSHTTNKIVQKSLEDLLEKLEQTTKLVQFELPRLELDRFWRGEEVKTKMCNSIAKFLKHQEQLTSFDMSQAQLTIVAGCKILEAIGLKARKLKDMDFQDFFHSRIAVFQVRRYKRAISRFSNLTHLCVNYNCICDEVLEILGRNLSGKLEYISIKVYRNDPHFHRISTYTWKGLRKVCPNLRVDVWFECMGTTEDIVPILAPDIPLYILHIWTGYDEEADWQIFETLRHVAACFTKTLTELSIESDNNREIFDGSLMFLLEKCKKLHEISLNSMMLVSTVEDICQRQLEKKISLKVCHLTLCDLKDVEYAELMYLKEKYVPTFEEQGLDFKIGSDLILDTT